MLDIYGTLGKVMARVRSFYKDFSVCLRMMGNVNNFAVNTELRQVSGVSSILLNIYVNEMVEEVYLKGRKVKISDRNQT